VQRLGHDLRLIRGPEVNESDVGAGSAERGTVLMDSEMKRLRVGRPPPPENWIRMSRNRDLRPLHLLARGLAIRRKAYAGSNFH